MMFLFNGIRAEVEPVPGEEGWYQLTGKHIQRWTMDVADTAGDLLSCNVEINCNARIRGIHSWDPEIELRDPRFNHENDEENASFFVYTERGDGRTYMILAVNQAEYAIFRHLVPHESGEEDEYDPIEDYRLDAPVAKKAPAKKPAAKKAKATA
ncbi:hypothetical protein [Paucibacter soli]|uniref:hypothetical protein n=1 Tax=Paucibacter soli TaxID=3133433 RepID=UPI0030AF1C6C